MRVYRCPKHGDVWEYQGEDASGPCAHCEREQRYPPPRRAPTDPAALTDEELAKWEIAWRANADPPPVLRLINALRANREALIRDAATIAILNGEVERLRALVEDAYSEDTGLSVWHNPAYADLVARAREAFNA